MRLRFQDEMGNIFQGNTYAQVVKHMRQYAWAEPGKQEYMSAVMERLRVSHEITTEPEGGRTARTFIKSLLNEGLLARVTN